jgi:hypothetical protein
MAEEIRASDVVGEVPDGCMQPEGLHPCTVNMLERPDHPASVAQSVCDALGGEPQHILERMVLILNTPLNG